MPRSILRLLLTTIVLASSSPAGAQLDELTLGLTQQGQILSQAPRLSGSRANEISDRAFNRLLGAYTVRSGPTLPYELSLIRRSDVNAFSTAAGKVYVTSEIAHVMGEEEGLWAAVLAHEIGHARGRHHYASYLRYYYRQQQIAYYRQRAAEGDQQANWALLGASLGALLVDGKLNRDEEHEADWLGLMMLAEAGYHPDFAITMYRKLAKRVGEQSKFAAFWSSHPRWATREQRTMKVYDDALAQFRASWPNAAESAGGAPPVILDVGNITARQDKVAASAVVSVPFTIRNGVGSKVVVSVSFSKSGVAVPSLLEDYKARDGQLGGYAVVQITRESETATAQISVPTAAIASKDRKVEARVVVSQLGSGEWEQSKLFKVSFPKKK